MAETPLPCLQPAADGATVFLTVHVQPRAAKARIAGLHGKALKVAVTSPPVDDKANKALIALLADLLDLPKSRLRLASGHRSRTKRLLIEAPGERVAAALRQALERTG
ncbi:MAG TPA: DUF167 domain-containing protein [Desulfobacterales bacterium]|nr:DUF167 domain-containing protein [Desulfobacterales bacterium]